MIGPDQIARFHQLEAELSNLRSALAWLRDMREDDRGLRLATALSTLSGSSVTACREGGAGSKPSWRQELAIRYPRARALGAHG